MKLQAINNYVLLELFEPKDNTGVAKPDTVNKVMRWGTILSVGPGVVDFNGNLMPLPVKEGDTVYGSAHGLEQINLAALKEYGLEVVPGDLRMVSVHDLMAILNDEETLDIQPLGQLIEIEKVKAPEKSEGGVLLVDGQKTPPSVAFVKTVGIGWFTPTNDPIPFHVEPGDVIYYHPYQTQVINFELLGKTHTKHVIAHTAIMGKINLSDEEKAKLRAQIEN